MRKRRIILTTFAALALAISANAGMTERETTTTTTYRGTISELSPSSSTMIVKSETSPETMRYVFNEKTMFVDPAGNTVKVESIQHQPVTVFYEKEGDQMVVTKVVTQKSTPSQVIEKKSTTTTTTTGEDH